MKIQGVAGSRHPSLKRGEPIQLPPEEKAKLMASETVINLAEEGWKRIPIKEEVIGAVQVIKGRGGIKNPEPDQYHATVKVTYKRLKFDGDKLFPATSTTIRILFKDSKDEIGMPDLELVDHKVL
jgi:hypothetical protein